VQRQGQRLTTVYRPFDTIVGTSGVLGLPARGSGQFATAPRSSHTENRVGRNVRDWHGYCHSQGVMEILTGLTDRTETGAAMSNPTPSSTKPGAHLLPVVLITMTLLVAVFLALSSYGVID
jgi:hypothetical protein